jgi:hypothetical protein
MPVLSITKERDLLSLAAISVLSRWSSMINMKKIFMLIWRAMETMPVRSKLQHIKRRLSLVITPTLLGPAKKKKKHPRKSSGTLFELSNLIVVDADVFD